MTILPVQPLRAHRTAATLLHATTRQPASSFAALLAGRSSPSVTTRENGSGSLAPMPRRKQAGRSGPDWPLVTGADPRPAPDAALAARSPDIGSADPSGFSTPAIAAPPFGAGPRLVAEPSPIAVPPPPGAQSAAVAAPARDLPRSSGEPDRIVAQRAFRSVPPAAPAMSAQAVPGSGGRTTASSRSTTSLPTIAPAHDIPRTWERAPERAPEHGLPTLERATRGDRATAPVPAVLPGPLVEQAPAPPPANDFSIPAKTFAHDRASFGRSGRFATSPGRLQAMRAREAAHAKAPFVAAASIDGTAVIDGTASSRAATRSPVLDVRQGSIAAEASPAPQIADGRSGSVESIPSVAGDRSGEPSIVSRPAAAEPVRTPAIPDNATPAAIVGPGPEGLQARFALDAGALSPRPSAVLPAPPRGGGIAATSVRLYGENPPANGSAQMPVPSALPDATLIGPMPRSPMPSNTRARTDGSADRVRSGAQEPAASPDAGRSDTALSARHALHPAREDHQPRPAAPAEPNARAQAVPDDVAQSAPLPAIGLDRADATGQPVAVGRGGAATSPRPSAPAVPAAMSAPVAALTSSPAPADFPSAPGTRPISVATWRAIPQPGAAASAQTVPARSIAGETGTVAEPDVVAAVRKFAPDPRMRSVPVPPAPVAQPAAPVAPLQSANDAAAGSDRSSSVSTPTRPEAALDGPAQVWVPALSRDLAAVADAAPRPARLRLRPAAMGDLDVALELRPGGVHIALTAAEPAAHRALTAARDDLAQALGEAGLALGGLSVALGQGSADAPPGRAPVPGPHAGVTPAPAAAAVRAPAPTSTARTPTHREGRIDVYA